LQVEKKNKKNMRSMAYGKGGKRRKYGSNCGVVLCEQRLILSFILRTLAYIFGIFRGSLFSLDMSSLGEESWPLKVVRRT